MSAEGVRPRGIGWLYVGDDGIEWSASHPVRSGEMPDARLIRRATNAELLLALKDAWEAHGEVVQSEGRLRTRLADAEDARRVLHQSLQEQAAARADPAMPRLTAEVLEKLEGDAEAAWALGDSREDRVAAHGLSLLCEWQRAALTAETGGRNEGS